jgi:hypothetical protein
MDQKKIRTIKELISILENIDDNTFMKYVNAQKNDFSNWIRDVFSMKDLASRIYPAKSGKDMARLILGR